MNPRLPGASPFVLVLPLLLTACLEPQGRRSDEGQRAVETIGSEAAPVVRELVASSPLQDPAGPHVMESAFCAKCHPAIYAEHEQSTHGRAFTDAEVRLATARFDLRDCIRCHTPRPIFETGVGQNPTRRHYGLEEGNTCMSCHWTPEYDYSNFQGGSECSQAFHPDVGTVEACASCHRNHGTPYQWEKAPTGKATGRTCMDCHMAEVERPVAVGGPVRAVRTHIFPGSRSEKQVNRAYAYSAAVEGSHAVVKIKNQGAGHNFPTELKQRSVESVVVVRDLQGNEVARSRMVFRDPYKRPYGLELPVNTQIPAGQTREHRVPIGVDAGTVETTLFFKQYYPIDDFHPDLSRVLESRTLPFSGVAPSDEEVDSGPQVAIRTPEGISAETSSVANLIDFARPPIGQVEVEVPAGDSPEDIRGLIDLFQFPVPQANADAGKRLVEIGLPAVPALIEALGSWDNKTYNQAMAALQKIGTPARPAIVAAMESEQLYERMHARKIVTRMLWRGEDVEAPLARALSATGALDRATAAEAIGILGFEGHDLALRGMLADSDPDVVRSAAMALVELGAVEAVEELEAALGRAYYPELKRDLAYALARLGSTAGMHELLAGLDFGDDLIRESFFESFFAVTGVHMGYDPLAPRPDRLEATAALQSWWASEGSPEALIPLDPDRDPQAEAHAFKLVGKLGGTDLGGSTPEEDQSAEDELVAMGKYAVPSLIRGLKYPAGFADKRARICRVLGRIGDPRSAPALTATLRDPVISVAAWAAWALEGIADPATNLALARYEQRLRTLIANGQVPPSAEPSDRLLAQAARTRFALGEDSARHTLAGLLLSDDEATRRIVYEALERRFGESYGYDPAGDEVERKAAAARWMEGL